MYIIGINKNTVLLRYGFIKDSAIAASAINGVNKLLFLMGLSYGMAFSAI